MRTDSFHVWDRRNGAEEFHLRGTLAELEVADAVKRHATAKGHFTVLVNLVRLREDSGLAPLVNCCDEAELRSVLFQLFADLDMDGVRDFKIYTMSASTKAITDRIHAEYRAAELKRRAAQGALDAAND